MKDLSNINVQDISSNDNGDFYANFKEKLNDVEQFPTLYTFKFIILATEKNKEDIAKIFEHPSTKIQIKDSKSGKYNSLSVETFVNSADEVVNYYKKVGEIEKVIML